MPKLMLEDEADFVIVGTGAGGATAARVLSEAGYSLAMIEEGAYLKPSDRPRELIDAMALAVRGMATLATDSLAPMPLLQGKAVGGSTAINSGIIWRLPEDVRRDWVDNYGLGAIATQAQLDRAFDQIEDELQVGPTDASIAGENNLLMQQAAEKLGLPGHVIVRNSKGCKGSQRCLQGCPNGARQSMDMSYVPRAMDKGARLHTRCHVERVVFEGTRATGVVGRVTDENGETAGTFSVRARRGVIVAASAIWSPLLLAKSGIRHPLLGKRFSAHPGAAVVGKFANPVHMGFGASQGYEVPMRDRGFKLEALSLPPDMLAARLPGAGREWQERLSSLGHYAQWGGNVRMEAMGSVRSSWLDGVSVRYEPTVNDLQKIREVLVLTGRMMFAAGATEVYPGLANFPEVVHSEKEMLALESAPLKRSHVHLVASHLFGTVCASSDPKRGVVGDDLAVHGRQGLYVMDASVFPTNLGVNPQHSIMGLVMVASERLAAHAAQKKAA